MICFVLVLGWFVLTWFFVAIHFVLFDLFHFDLVCLKQTFFLCKIFGVCRFFI